MEQSGWGRVTVSRRGVVVVGGVIAAGAALSADALLGSVVDEVVDEAAARFGVGKIRVDRVRRGADLLVANLVIANLTHQELKGKGVLFAGREPGYLSLILPGQSLGETVDFPEEGDLPYEPRRNPAELALPAVLAFEIEPNSSIPYSLDALLNLAKKRPVDKLVRRKGKVISPGTHIEAPYRMRLQPHSKLRWYNDTRPKYLNADDGPTTAELWHARLAGQTLGASGTGVPRLSVDPRGTINKVVAFPDKDPYGPGPVGEAIETPLTPGERSKIYQNAPDFNTQLIGGEVAKAPVVAEEVILSALGATLDLNGQWPAATNGAIKWDHRATLGRDNYVRVVQAGWLAPYRHRAVLIVVTERRMLLSPDVLDRTRAAQALLVKRFTLVVTEPIADTDLEDLRREGGTTRGLEFPFTQVACRQTVTSGLTGVSDILTEGGMPLEIVAGVPRPLRLPFVGRDHLGQQIPFESAVWFVPGPEQRNPGALDPAKPDDRRKWERWNTESSDRAAGIAGLPVAIAPEHPDHPGLSTVPLTGLRVDVATLQQGAYPPWRPVAASLAVDSPGISALGGGGPVAHSYHAMYLADQDNRGGIVLGTDDGPEVDKETSGGLVPLPQYRGLSRTSGSIMAMKPSALDRLGGASVPDPGDVIRDLFEGVYLLGPLQLSDIVKPVAGMFDVVGRATSGTPGNSVPGVTHEVRDGRVYVDLDLNLPLKYWRGGPLAFKPSADSLHVKAHVESGGDTPTEVSIDARLQKVAVEFAGVIALPIAEFRARIGTGGKSFDFEVENVQFLKELAFLQPLSEFLQLGAAEGGLGKQSALDRPQQPYADRTGTSVAKASAGAIEGVDAFIDEDGLHLAAGFGLPDVPLGAFSLSGLNFGIGVDLPFGGGLEIHAWFASHEDPFQVTYCGFGGGGYVDIVIGDVGGETGLKRISASLFVSARLGIDLIVASGELAVRVGLVLTIEAGKSPTIAAYFRISGSVSIPLVASVSVTFELTLKFRPALEAGERTVVAGTATFLLDVQVVVVSGTYEATLSKTFRGGRNGRALGEDDDPFRSLARSLPGAADLPDDQPLGFRDVHPTSATWRDFAAAFATA